MTTKLEEERRTSGRITGRKKGGGGGGAVEDNNTLRSKAYARVLDLVGEGEIEGLVNGAQSIYLNETPLQNADGTFNFDCQVDYRVGTQGQTHIPGFEAVENEISVGIEVKKAAPVVRQITNLNIDSVRVRLQIPALTRQDTTNGNLHGSSVTIAIDIQYANSGVWEQVIQDTIDGKTTSSYEKGYRVQFNKSRKGPWQVRMRRITDDSTVSSLNNKTYFASMTEIIESKLSYPNSAIFGLQVGADQFDSVPSRAYHLKMLRVRVPSNYNPVTRAYTGAWDGTFKIAWTNNPAWCYYDLCTSDVYGLGRHIPEEALDKWALYAIGKYCDELVPNGKGGQEPRYTLNVYIQSAMDAYKLLQNMAAALGGISFYASNSIVTIQDRPEDPKYLFTNGNVFNGEFNYSGSAKNARHTVALVSWNDMTDFGRSKVEYVENPDAVAKYGIITTSVSAFGCTSAGQAHRFGRAILASELLLTETVSFTTGLEGVIAYPGMVIKVRDNYRYGGKRLGGRIRAFEGTDVVVLDAEVDPVVGSNPEISLITAGGKVHSCKAYFIAGSKTRMRLDKAVTSDMPVKGATWVMSMAGQAEPRLYRIVSVGRGSNGFDITALQYDAAKYAYTDDITGTSIGQAEGGGSAIGSIKDVPPAPTSLSLQVVEHMQGAAQTYSLELGWASDAINAASWEVEHRPEAGNPVIYTTSVPSFSIGDVGKGFHVVQVRAVSRKGLKSAWSTAGQVYAGNSTVFTQNGSDAFSWAKAQSSFLSINLSWQLKSAALQRCKTVEIWAWKVGLNSAYVKLAQVGGDQTSFSHQGMNPGEEWRYRLVAIDQFGNASGQYPSNDSLTAKASTDVTEVLNLLNDSFVNSSFYKGLSGGIAQLEAEVTKIGSDINIDGSLQDVIDRVRRDISRADELLLRQVVVDEEVRNELTGAIVKVTDQIRTYQDAITTEVARVQGILAQQITDGDNGVKTTVTAQVQEEQRVRISADNALGLRIDSTVAEMRTEDTRISGLVTNEQKARADADSALASSITLLEAKVTKGDGDGAAALAAAIATEQKARADADGAIATSVTALEAKVTKGDGDNAAAITAAISTEQKARADADTALAASVTALEAKVVKGDGDNATAITAAIAAEQKARADGDSAQATALNALKVQMGTDIAAAVATETSARVTQDTVLANSVTSMGASVEGKLNAAIASEQKVRGDADTALASSITTMGVTWEGKLNAAIAAEQKTRADADTANATSITQVSARLNNIGGVTLEQKFDAQAGVNSGLSAQYTVKIDNNGWVSGFGLASTPINGVPVSTFAVNADRFVIGGSGVGTVTPFQVVTAGQYINGRYVPPGVYMNDAYIKNGFITSAKIGNLAVETISIQDRAVTTSATVTTVPSTIYNVIYDGRYPNEGLLSPAHWTERTILTTAVTSNAGSEAMTIFVNFPRVTAGSSWDGGESGGAGTAPSGVEWALLRDGIKIAGEPFPLMLPTTASWFSVGSEPSYIYTVVDIPASGYHVYKLLLRSGGSGGSAPFSYKGSPSLTIMNSKK